MKLAAVIADTRYRHETYSDIVQAHKKHLPSDTHFIYKNSFEPSIEGYNRLLTSADFWRIYVECEIERVLFFQHDSMLLRSGIEEFYDYDYVGAPFWFQPNIGGNGGLSLRNPKIMLEICEKYTWDGSTPEDVWFCNLMHDKKIGNLAPREVCEKFSVESVFALGSLGFHAISKYLTPEQCEQIKNQYK